MPSYIATEHDKILNEPNKSSAVVKPYAPQENHIGSYLGFHRILACSTKLLITLFQNVTGFAKCSYAQILLFRNT